MRCRSAGCLFCNPIPTGPPSAGEHPTQGAPVPEAAASPAAQELSLGGGPALPDWLDAYVEEAHHIGSLTESDYQRILDECDRLEREVVEPMNPLRSRRVLRLVGVERRAVSRRWRWWQDIWPTAKGVLVAFAAGAVIFLMFLLSLDGVTH